MSSEIAVNIKKLTKYYVSYRKPSDRLRQFFSLRLNKILASNSRLTYADKFFALSDVSMEIKKGETIGIIGRNGSGKSTILQVICGILNPSSGDVEVSGKVAALLELGSGFNLEYTGRENIYLNATILGLSRSQIDERYSQIEKFADIGEFIEQPVKTYSTGMYVRLAFAVIAHVDADILVIDEALAVGDAVFVQKCMRFIHKFRKKGTLIFVSHDAGAVMALCDRAVWLDKGVIRRSGSAKEVCEDYLRFTLQEVYSDEIDLLELNEGGLNEVDRDLEHSISSNNFLAAPYGGLFEVGDNLSESTGWKTGKAEIISINLKNETMDGSKVLKGGEYVRLSIAAKIHDEMAEPIIGFVVRDKRGQDLFGENTFPFTQVNQFSARSNTTIQAEFNFQLPMLPNGQYSIMCSIANGDLFNNIQHHWLNEALIFTVASSEVRWGLVGVRMREIKLLGLN